MCNVFHVWLYEYLIKETFSTNYNLWLSFEKYPCLILGSTQGTPTHSGTWGSQRPFGKMIVKKFIFCCERDSKITNVHSKFHHQNPNKSVTTTNHQHLQYHPYFLTTHTTKLSHHHFHLKISRLISFSARWMVWKESYHDHIWGKTLPSVYIRNGTLQ